MTRNEKAVMLFGRKMRETDDGWGARMYQGHDGAKIENYLHGWAGEHPYTGTTVYRASPHAAARALERKIRAAHKRLGKLIGGGR